MALAGLDIERQTGAAANPVSPASPRVDSPMRGLNHTGMPYSDDEVDPPPPPPERPSEEEVFQHLRSRLDSSHPWLSLDDVAKQFTDNHLVFDIVMAMFGKWKKLDLSVTHDEKRARREAAASIRSITLQQLEKLCAARRVDKKLVSKTNTEVYKAIPDYRGQL